MKMSVKPGELYALNSLLERMVGAGSLEIPLASFAVKVRKAIERLPELYPELAADAT
jgi:hypothetical protein